MKLALTAKQFYAVGIVSAILNTLAMLGLWGLVDQTLNLHTGYYVMPFGYIVPWWFAGDIFVTMGIASILLTCLIAIAEEK